MIPCVLPDNELLFPSNNPVIITVAAIGAEHTKKSSPYVPLNPERIIQEAIAIDLAGAHVLHLHVRDAKGKPTCDPKLISKVVKEIKKKTKLIVQISTGGAVTDTDQARVGTLVSGVDMGSLTLGSVNFGNEIFANPLPLIRKLATKMKQKKIKPELEIFDAGMVETAYQLIEEKLVVPPLHFNIILGGPGWLAATEENLDFILKKLPAGSTWSGSGIGRFQKSMMEWALARGGHVRTGLEDNLYLSKGILAKGNVELTEQAKEFIHQSGRKTASPTEARQLLSIQV